MVIFKLVELRDSIKSYFCISLYVWRFFFVCREASNGKPTSGWYYPKRLQPYWMKRKNETPPFCMNKGVTFATAITWGPQSSASPVFQYRPNQDTPGDSKLSVLGLLYNFDLSYSRASSSRWSGHWIIWCVREKMKAIMVIVNYSASWKSKPFCFM